MNGQSKMFHLVQSWEYSPWNAHPSHSEGILFSLQIYDFQSFIIKFVLYVYLQTSKSIFTLKVDQFIFKLVDVVDTISYSQPDFDFLL